MSGVLAGAPVEDDVIRRQAEKLLPVEAVGAVGAGLGVR